jgi:two-component system, NarL family, nitrate/nitrite sensor histidine kinase NarX
VTIAGKTNKLGRKLTALAVIYLAIAVAAIGCTLYASWQLEGGAGAINLMGSERMRAWHIAAMLAQSATETEVQREIAAFERILAQLENGDPARPLILPKSDDARRQFRGLRTRWTGEMRPAIAAALVEQAGSQRAGHAAAYLQRTAHFVDQIDALVLTVERELAANTTLLRSLQFGLVAMSVIGTIALVYLLFLLIVRPVVHLEDGMRRMEAGDFAVRVPVETSDELGALAAGFNRMAAHLSDLYASLERRVEEKTRSLAARNDELATLYEAAALLAEPIGVEELCRGFLRKLASRLGAQAAAVRIADGPNGDMHLFVQEGMPADLIESERCIAHDWCLCGEAAQRQHGGAYPLRRHTTAGPEYACARAGFETIAVFPIRFRDRVLGVFNLFFDRPHKLTAADRHMLETLGRHLGMAIENQRLIAREKEMAVSEERNLLAQELHDSIAQSLAFLNMQAQMLEDSLEQGETGRAQAELAQIRAGIQASYDDVRELLVHFRTRASQTDLESAIGQSLARLESQTGIRTSFTRSGRSLPLSPETEVQVLHIVQEALSNVRKHAGAREVEVDLQRGPVYRFRVRDDGRGFETDAEGPDTQVGLRIMRERAQRIGGRLTVQSRPAGGTEVVLELAVREQGGIAA